MNFDLVKEVTDNIWDTLSGFEKTKVEIADLMIEERKRILSADTSKMPKFKRDIIEAEKRILQGRATGKEATVQEMAKLMAAEQKGIVEDKERVTGEDATKQEIARLMTAEKERISSADSSGKNKEIIEKEKKIAKGEIEEVVEDVVVAAPQEAKKIEEEQIVEDKYLKEEKEFVDFQAFAKGRQGIDAAGKKKIKMKRARLDDYVDIEAERAGAFRPGVVKRRGILDGEDIALKMAKSFMGEDYARAAGFEVEVESEQVFYRVK